jgi:predicted Zn-dependent protease
VPDDIRSLTSALARDPRSLVYADLAEALRRRGQRQEALQVVLQGLTRHPMHADGHDCLARIYADLGDLERARELHRVRLRVDGRERILEDLRLHASRGDCERSRGCEIRRGLPRVALIETP